LLDAAVVMQNRMPKPIGRPMPGQGRQRVVRELDAMARRRAALWFESRAGANAESQPRPSGSRARIEMPAMRAKRAAAYKRFLTNYRVGRIQASPEVVRGSHRSK
jgi:hypothetical protein